MALFSKPPAKKPDPPKTDSRSTGPRPVSAREVAAQAAGRKAAPARPASEPTGADITVTGASLLDWSASAAPSAIEVAQANPGLCSVLENAALMFASNQAQQARALLDHGVATDEDTRLSPLAWLALFDLLQRANDRAAFDQLALQFVVQFERSAPAWEEPVGGSKPRTLSRPVSGGYVAITGMVTSGVASPLEGLKRAVEKRIAQARVDLSQVTGYDDGGAGMLSDLLAQARKQKLDLAIQRPEKLRALLEDAVKSGKDGGEAAWLLSLELMQWEHDQAGFDDRAVEFAITFELSPPSWEPPPEPPPEVKQDALGAGDKAAPSVDAAARGRDAQALAWSGVLAGSSARQLVELNDYAISHNVVAIDMSDVERIDFVCAGAMLNHINRIEGQRKSVQIGGASPIIRALLLLIGISPRHFVRNSN